MIGTERGFANLERAFAERAGGFVVPLRTEQLGQVVQAGGRRRVLRAERHLINLERAFAEWAGGSVVALEGARVAGIGDQQCCTVVCTWPCAPHHVRQMHAHACHRRRVARVVRGGCRINNRILHGRQCRIVYHCTRRVYCNQPMHTQCLAV